MRVRALDENHDWTFGKGKNDYLIDIDAVVQDINTRLLSFLGDCFFATNQGIDWWKLLGGKDKKALTSAISSTILNTAGVNGLVELNVVLDNTRNIFIQYQVTTVYSQNQVLGSVTV